WHLNRPTKPAKPTKPTEDRNLTHLLRINPPLWPPLSIIICVLSERCTCLSVSELGQGWPWHGGVGSTRAQAGHLFHSLDFLNRQITPRSSSIDAEAFTLQSNVSYV
ncbi:unnamed protein product, partial [Scytosiphon promiscuus]